MHPSRENQKILATPVIDCTNCLSSRLW